TFGIFGAETSTGPPESEGLENCSSVTGALYSGNEGRAMDLHNITAAAPGAIYSPSPVPAEQFVDGIRALSEGVITKQKIYDFLISYEIRRDDLERYAQWLPDRHTRNKIFRNQMIEVMLICWPIGAITPLHTHNGQLGWMTMIDGAIIVREHR